MGRKPTPAPVRFWSKVDKNGPNGCWVWIAGKTPAGYGDFRHDPKKNSSVAHRYSWEQIKGPIPKGLQLDHRVCRNKACVNPDHMVVCTGVENWLQPDGCAGINKAKTHCPKGHPYSGDNLFVYGSGPRKGKRLCLTCNYECYERRVASGAHAARVRRWKEKNGKSKNVSVSGGERPPATPVHVSPSPIGGS